jgi:hydroxyacylglutathione hydrolase
MLRPRTAPGKSCKQPLNVVLMPGLGRDWHSGGSKRYAGVMTELQIHQFPCLQDNYGVLVHSPDDGLTASIDAPDAAAVARAAAERGWKLTHILTTHHHADHTGGNLALKAQTHCTIIGPKGEAARIPGLDRAVAGGDTIAFGHTTIHVLDTPGHTLGHISYLIPAIGTAFVGDTLFAMGCGRVIEGTPDMMWTSLRRIAALPPGTRLYCGHEYTVANGRFALTIDPDNETLKKRLKACEVLRARGEPTLPTRLDIECETNPFLRCTRPEIRARLGLPEAPDWQVFAEVRERKNRA